MTPDELKKAIEQAMWDGDTDRLDELAPCGCCCWEHYHWDCPARVWNGCRGQDDIHGERAKWQEHYKKFHGMTEAEFDGEEPEEPRENSVSRAGAPG